MISILKQILGAKPEKLERRGDALMDRGSWGAAKLAFERALELVEKQSDMQRENRGRLCRKIGAAKEALARQHLETAQDLNEGGHFDEAIDLLNVALEITSDDSFRQELQAVIDRTKAMKKTVAVSEAPVLLYGLDDPDGGDTNSDENLIFQDDEYFQALCATLPETLQAAYQAYGENFRAGFVALNRGDFGQAADFLHEAMAEHPQPDSYIPLELATALAHLDRLTEAKLLLRGLLAHHPDALPAYQLLCEIYWEQNEFESAAALLATVPDELRGSLAFVLLQGETQYRAGRFQAAKDLYQRFQDRYGWHDAVAMELAKVFEEQGDRSEAIDLYAKMISRCRGCGARIDPLVQHRFAELQFSEGRYTVDVLETYLFLAREKPENAALYFDRARVIYEARGDHGEAERFRAFSEQAKSESERMISE